MLERLSPTKRNWALFAVLLLVGWFAWSIRSVLNPLFIGYLFAFMLHPLVERVQGLGFSRRAAVNMIFVAGFVGATLLLQLLALQARQLALDTLGASEGAASPRERFNAALAEYVGELEETIQVELPRPELPELKKPLRETLERLTAVHAAPLGPSGSERGAASDAGADSAGDPASIDPATHETAATGNERVDPAVALQAQFDELARALSVEPPAVPSLRVPTFDERGESLAGSWDAAMGLEMDALAQRIQQAHGTSVAAPELPELDRALRSLAPLDARIKSRIDAFATRIEGWIGWRPPSFAVPSELRSLSGIARDYLDTHEEEVRDAAERGLGFVARLVRRVATLVGMFVLVPLYTYYLLFELGRIHGFVRRYLPVRERDRIARVGGRIGGVIANFFRGRLSVCLLKGLFLSVGLLVAGIDYAFLLGMASGFLSLVPFIGPFIGFVGAFAIGMVGDHTFVSALLRTGIVFILGEVLEGYVLMPKILGDSLGLHPLVVLFSILAGGAALGTFGVLAALPITASLVILFQEFVMPALRDFADEDGDGRPDPVQ